MKAHTRAGGRIIPLALYGFTILSVMGGGLSTPNNISTPLALPGGAYFQRTTYPAHTFDLVGNITANTPNQLRRNHRGLIETLDSARHPDSQPMYLLYEPLDDCGNSTGETLEIPCSFAGGLEGQRDNLYQENISLRFQVYLPYIASLYGAEGAALSVRDSFGSLFTAYKGTNGVWKWPGSPSTVSHQIYAAVWMPDGRVLVGGAFTGITGVINTAYLAIYNPLSDSWQSASSTTLNGAVRAILPLADGRFLIGGEWTSVTPTGGGLAASWIFIYNPATSAYQRATTAEEFNALIRAFALLPDNTVAVGGDFTNAGGANGDYLTGLNIAAGTVTQFVSSNPLNGLVRTIQTSPTGAEIVFGGDFTDVRGISAADFIAAYQFGESQYSYVALPFATPFNARVNVLKFVSSGRLAAGGNFTDVSGDSAHDYFSLGQFLPIGSSTPQTFVFLDQKVIENLDGEVLAVTEVSPGAYLIGGAFTALGSAEPLFDGLIYLVGNTVQPIDVDFPGTLQINTLASRIETGEVFVGHSQGSGTSYTSGTTTINNTGTVDAFPVITIKYASAATVVAPLYSVRNITTDQVLSFNLSLLPGETLTIDLRPGKKKITSDVRGDLTGTLLPGSPLATFKLAPGANVLNIFIDIASASNASAYAYWVPNFSSIEDATH